MKPRDRQLVAPARGALLLLALLLAAHGGAAQQRPGEPFHAIQEQVAARRHAMLHSTVGLRLRSGSGSGVIISAEGHVLTAAHVVGEPGRECTVHLTDGRQFPGRSLGHHPEGDFALVKFDAPPDLTVATLGDSNTLRRSQWVVATGHPLGVRNDRPPALRLGRVAVNPRPGDRHPHAGKVVTDAPLITGDSGGPLFDLGGRVVGIHSMVSSPNGQREGISLHTLINLPRGVLAQLKQPQVLTEAGPSHSFIEPFRLGRQALEGGRVADAVRHLHAAVAVDADDATSWFLLARAYERQDRSDAALAALERAIALGFNDVDALTRARDFARLARQPRFQTAVEPLQRFAGIPGNRRSDSAFKTAAQHASPYALVGAVRILSDDQEVAWGLLATRDGDVLTKASELPSGPLTCALPGGQELPAFLAAIDERWDIALLRVPGAEAEPVRFTSPPKVGDWLLTPDEQGRVAAVGVGSVDRGAISGRGLGNTPAAGSGYLGVRLAEIDFDTVQRTGLPGGAQVLFVEPNTPAEAAGLRRGDILYQVDELSVPHPGALIDYLSRLRPGNQVALLILRDDDEIEREVTLGARPAGSQPGSLAAALSGEVSRMQGPFPEVFQHDTALRPSQIGGPVLNLDGRCVGMNIARADRTATYAIPGPLVMQLHERLRRQAGGPG